MRYGRNAHALHDKSLLNLEQIANNTEVILMELDSGKRLKRKLQEMGLTLGIKFKVLNNNLNGPVIVNVRGSKLALGHGMVEKIYVKEANKRSS